jgi:hypothetical protein
MLLILLAPAIAQADTFDINVNFGGGFTGSGSFNTDGMCNICPVGGGMLTNFTFTVDDDTFNEASAVGSGLAYNRSLNELGSTGGLHGADNVLDSLSFNFDRTATFRDSDDPPTSATAIVTITAVPEPSSLVLLAGVIGWLVFGLPRRFRKKSAIH